METEVVYSRKAIVDLELNVIIFYYYFYFIFFIFLEYTDNTADSYFIQMW